MEPDGARLQLHPASQHYGLRALRCMRPQGASVAPGRVGSSHGPPPDRPAEVFGAHHALVRTPSIPTAFARLIAEFLPSLVGQFCWSNSSLRGAIATGHQGLARSPPPGGAFFD